MTRRLGLAVAGLLVVALPAVLIGGVVGALTGTGPAGGRLAAGTGIPRALVREFEQAAASCPGLPAAWLAAQARVESGFNPRAVSRAGAQGLMQFLPATFARYGVDGDRDGAADPFDPTDAIWSAARYACALREAVAGIPGDPLELTVAAYNAGPGAVIASRGVPPFAETRGYVRAVAAWAARYAAPELDPECAVDPAGGDGGQRLQPVAAAGRIAVMTAFCVPPERISGWRATGSVPGSDHPRGLAIDVAVPDDRVFGEQLAAWVADNAAALHVRYVIWDAAIWHPERGWQPYLHPDDPSGQDPSLSHRNHVHISFQPTP